MQYDDAKAIMWLGLALLFGAGGLGLGYALWRTGRMLRRVEGDLHRTVDEFVPLITKANVSMDAVNDQLGKVDVMMDSAVDMVDALDISVRTVSHAVVEPVKAVAGAMAGVSAAAASFRDHVSNPPPHAGAEPAADGFAADAEAGDDDWADPFDELDDDQAGEAGAS